MSWLDDPINLFRDFSVIPDKNDTNEDKINTLTRLLMVVYIIMSVLKYKKKNEFFINTLLIILLLYLFSSKKPKEKFAQMDSAPVYRYPLIAQNKLSSEKMKLQPVIIPRAHDREVWSFPSYKHSAVNYKNAGYDLMNEFAELPDKINYKERDYRQGSYTDFNFKPYGDIADVKKLPSNSAVGNEYKPPNTTPVNITDGKVAISSLKEGTPQREVILEPFGEVGNMNVRTYADVGAYGMSDATNKRLQPNVGGYYQVIPEENDSVNDLPNLPPQDLLIPKTTTSLYGPGMVVNNERMKYLENIEPNKYSYSDVAYPINNNLGISFTPAIPPVVLDQVATNDGMHPLYHRIDPQLIRAEGLPEERKNELPYRNDWSAKYSGFDAAPGTVNFEDIYDPRFNGYGDGTRSYFDANGQVNYYYSDIDAYRNPNFGLRSKVDFIDYTDPMGRVIPEYHRNVGINDVKQAVEQQWDADQTYFREGLQERMMRKRNSELWQLRARPMSKGQSTMSFTSAR